MKLLATRESLATGSKTTMVRGFMAISFAQKEEEEEEEDDASTLHL
jgi:hypothetical protein